MSGPQPPEGEELKAPFGFKLMVVLVVIYLGWRLVQGVLWLIDRIG
ncbi:MAG TPA: hypothetical protein VJA46_12340 [Acidimicrobiia bacterium]|nr:hypothetical protein [Acidimicrobiia bacterium]